jgi:hypothetical protein
MSKNKHVYFLHIPKTSGMKMQYDLLAASQSANSKNFPNAYIQDVAKAVYIPGEFEFVFNPEIAESHNIICGHFARNPISVIEELVTFSMVREPFEQYLSLAKYAAMQSGVDFTEEFLDLFLSNDNEFNTQFEGMSGCENPQSCFLFSKIACIKHEPYFDEYGNLVETRYQSFFVEKPKSYSELSEKLDGIIVGTVENRARFVETINDILFDLYGIKISNNDSVVNGTPKPTFKISKQHKSVIYSKIEIDIELYEKIKESEHE